MSPSRAVWRRIVGFAFVATAFLFLGFLVLDNVAEVRRHEWSVRPALLVVSVLVNILSLSWGVRVWQLVLASMGASVRYLDLARIWFLSGLGRYIPGKIWQFVGAARLGGDAGLAVSATVTGLAIHTGFFILGALMVALYLVPPPVGEFGGVALQMVRWIGPILLLAGHPAVIRTVLRIVRRVSSALLALEWRGRWVDGVVLILLSAAGWVVSGIALYLFILSFTPLPPSALLGIVGINALSFVAGYLVVIAPAGLGAKEVALTALLSIYIPPPIAALLAAATRLWTIAAEVIPALVLVRMRPPEAAVEADDARS